MPRPGKLEFKLFARWMASVISHSRREKHPAHICNLVRVIVGRKAAELPQTQPTISTCTNFSGKRTQRAQTHMHTLFLCATVKRCFLILVVFDPILKHIPTQMKARCRTFSIQMGCQEEGLRTVSAESAIKPMLSSSPMASNALNVPTYTVQSQGRGILKKRSQYASRKSHVLCSIQQSVNSNTYLAYRSCLVS